MSGFQRSKKHSSTHLNTKIYYKGDYVPKIFIELKKKRRKIKNNVSVQTGGNEEKISIYNPEFFKVALWVQRHTK